ncbi:hypothetical protein AB0299_20575 [Pseudarthrobacter sp. NPDC080037]|uniref:hypothetical protein n=1 Tax=Pseudarthrobacter sp. NPDC080037 TaxID=3155289 RepID=UPI00344B281E
MTGSTKPFERAFLDIADVNRTLTAMFWRSNCRQKPSEKHAGKSLFSGFPPPV